MTSACLRCITRSLHILQEAWHQASAFISTACDGNEREEQSLPRIICRFTSLIMQLLLTTDDPLVLSSALGAYAACCDTGLAISSGTSSSKQYAEELLSWMKRDGTSFSVMKVMIRCFYFPAAHTVCVAAMKAMKLICTSMLKHHNSDSMPAIISDIVFPMLQLVLDTSHMGATGGNAEFTLECDQMKRFTSCMTARLNCAASFPWLLAFARMDASDSFQNGSATIVSSKLHCFMMNALLLGESSVFAQDAKTRSFADPQHPILRFLNSFSHFDFCRTAAVECLYALTSSGWAGPQWLPHSRLFNCGKVTMFYDCIYSSDSIIS